MQIFYKVNSSIYTYINIYRNVQLYYVYEKYYLSIPSSTFFLKKLARFDDGEPGTALVSSAASAWSRFSPEILGDDKTAGTVTTDGGLQFAVVCNDGDAGVSAVEEFKVVNAEFIPEEARKK